MCSAGDGWRTPENVTPPVLRRPWTILYFFQWCCARRSDSSCSVHHLIKMSFGKLYGGNQDFARVWRSRAAAKLAGLDIEFVEAKPGQGAKTPEFLALNPQGKVPVFVGADGFVLSESRAIALYCTLPALPLPTQR